MKAALHRLSLILLGFLHIFLGINGLAGGLLLAVKSDGSLLGMQPDWLNRTPFQNYLIPGILLALFLGILPLLTFIGLIIRRNWRFTGFFNLYTDKHWAWSFSLYTGIIAIIWITVQLILTQYFWIQPVIIFTGLFIIILTLLPGVMKYYDANTGMLKNHP